MNTPPERHMPLAQSARVAADLRARLAEAFKLDADDQAIDDTISGEVDLPEQIAAVVKQIAETEAFEEAVSKLVDAYQARGARLYDKTQKLRSLVAWALQEAGYKKMPLPGATLTLSDGKAPLIVDDVPLSQIPPEFKRTTEAVDKVALREAIARGERVSFARLGNAAPKLTIRRG